MPKRYGALSNEVVRIAVKSFVRLPDGKLSRSYSKSKCITVHNIPLDKVLQLLGDVLDAASDSISPKEQQELRIREIIDELRGAGEPGNEENPT